MTYVQPNTVYFPQNMIDVRLSSFLGGGALLQMI